MRSMPCAVVWKFTCEFRNPTIENIMKGSLTLHNNQIQGSLVSYLPFVVPVRPAAPSDFESRLGGAPDLNAVRRQLVGS